MPHHPLITWSRIMKRATGISTPMLCPLCDPGIQTAARHGSLRGLTGQFLVRPQFKVPCHHRLTVQIKTGKIQYIIKFSGTSATKSRARVTKVFFFLLWRAKTETWRWTKSKHLYCFVNVNRQLSSPKCSEVLLLLHRFYFTLECQLPTTQDKTYFYPFM